MRWWIHADLMAAKENWVVYAKRPFAGPQAVLKYLSGYTHRVAISNRRLLGADTHTVTFSYKDYADGARRKTMTLGREEFVRRFCLHLLPQRFVKIRHYGLLGNRQRVERLQWARTLLGVAAPAMPDIAAQPLTQDPPTRGVLSVLPPTHAGPAAGSSSPPPRTIPAGAGLFMKPPHGQPERLAFNASVQACGQVLAFRFRERLNSSPPVGARAPDTVEFRPGSAQTCFRTGLDQAVGLCY